MGGVRESAAAGLSCCGSSALLSANLAVINILPFPPMDGGRVAMALVQAAQPATASARAAERVVYLTGFVVLMALLVIVDLVDIRRLTGG